MSTHNINTDNQIPHSTAVEEKKWRCTNKMNNGEYQSAVVISPHTKTGGVTRRLSGMNEIPMPCSAKLSDLKQKHPGAFFVRLADESPKRNWAESDSSTYDSCNCRETDICRDSSDTDSDSSYSTENIKTTIKVVEYEVASASGSENLFTSDSSSGTDDVFIAAVAICDTSKYSSDFADTEEDSSDADKKSDPELGPGDYWVCVKCKNKKNNPMFRYCEKCYQIRKTHFPPRPRLRKSRSTFKSHKSQMGSRYIQRSATISEINETLKLKKEVDIRKVKDTVNSKTPTTSSDSVQRGSISTPGRLLVGISQSQLNSTGDSSSDDDNTASQFFKHLNNIPNSSPTLDKDNEQKPAPHLRTATKRKCSRFQSKYKTSPKRPCYEEKAVISSVPSDPENETDFLLSQPIYSTQGTQKDSGFSSAPSSQERKKENDDDCVLDGDNCGDTSDTVCDELNDSDIAEMSEEKNCVPSSVELDLFSQDQPLDRPVSFGVHRSTTEPHVISPLLQGLSPAISPLVQSISECSDAYTNIKPSVSNPELLDISSLKKNKLRSLQSGRSTASDGEFPTYGSCMTCLTEPKNGVFVHSRFLHLCCCYKCAVKIWNKNKKCPICNCAVKNVMKLFVH